ncbi:MAG: hypothetical protein JWO80_302 [Bryobacterales bacterium]|nr:hypothetical protein [Bryobacterales bacterium]
MLEALGIHARPALDRMELIAVGMRILIEPYFFIKPMESMTSVSPSHQPIDSPKNEGSGSAECLLPSVGITR